MEAKNNETISYKQGVADGVKSKSLKNPIHKNWNGKPHFNADYERGYWHGYSK